MYTVGSHLSELQLAEDVSYPNALPKAAPATFVDRKVALVV